MAFSLDRLLSKEDSSFGKEPGAEKNSSVEMSSKKEVHSTTQSVAKNKEIEILKKEIESIQDLNSEEDALNPERKADMVLTFKKLKAVLEDKKINQKVKDLLLDANVSAVLAGVKPASEIIPRKEKKFLFIVERPGINKKDIEQLKNVLKYFGAGLTSQELIAGMYHIAIYKNENVIKALEESGAFTSAEIDFARESYSSFDQHFAISAKRNDFASAFRIGYVYGYPPEDVQEHIQRYRVKEKYLKLGMTSEQIQNAVEGIQTTTRQIDQSDLEFLRKEAKTIAIKGIKNVVPWTSYHPESQSVRNKIKEFEEVFKIEREVLDFIE